ncbi:MAG TPA: sialidase family protein [Terriglobales bacterium]|nr:sialidase family protein [Terriglobales bacterium]
MHAASLNTRFTVALIVGALLFSSPVFASGPGKTAADHVLAKMQLASSDKSVQMSSMGRLAHLVQQARQNQPNGGAGMSFRVTANGSVIPILANGTAGGKPDLCFGGDEDCSDTGFSDGPGATQSELSIALDKTGQHVVIGFNDFRGFSLNPLSVSGFAYSDDGGATFTDGQQLPTTGTTTHGQVFGDPDVKYVPGGNGCQFIYSSIFINPAGQETMSIHRSTDCGHSWAGPFEVTAATTPDTPGDAADKEFIAVDPDTGRVGMSWSNFVNGGAGGVEIRFTYSDNIMTATPPTWSAGVVLNSGSPDFDTGSEPRFAGNGSNKVYVAWSGQSTFYTAQTKVAVSNDNGVTFGAPVLLDQSPLLIPTFFIDFILGNDRVHQFPSIAVDNSWGPHSGNVYVVYATNADLDGADVVVHRSTDGGVTWSEPTVLSSRPGNDRAQWFPTVSVDNLTGRVNVVYDDQGVAVDGDLMEMTWLHSDDGGNSWSKPSPITPRPFHAGYGNDTGQPNLGDYNASVSQDGWLYTVFTTAPNHAFFTDGEPGSASFPYPSVLGNTVPGGTAAAPGFVKTAHPVASLHLGQVSFAESGGNGLVDAGDVVAYTFPITNYVTNPATSPGNYTGVFGKLSTSTPGVFVFGPTSPYGTVKPGDTRSNLQNYLVYVMPTFVPGTPIEFALDIFSVQGSTRLLYSQPTGTPVPTTLLSENFDEVAPGAIPAGWATAHGGGVNVVPWTTNKTFCGTTSNAAFHQDKIDGPTPTSNPTRFERLFSPIFAVPANSQYVTLDMDVCYDTEDDPLESILAYDGFTLRITDQTPGHVLRSVFPEAYEEAFTTDSFNFFPKHFPRSGNGNYFQDISAWSGSSGGRHFDNNFGGFLHNPPVPLHVHMKLPGMAATNAQLRFEYTQDGGGTCLDVGGGPVCGVQVDNIVVQSVVTKSDELSLVVLQRSGPRTWDGNVIAQPIAGAGGIPVSLSSNSPNVTFSQTNLVIPAGSQVSPHFTVTVKSGAIGNVVITATGPSNSRSTKLQ